MVSLNCCLFFLLHLLGLLLQVLLLLLLPHLLVDGIYLFFSFYFGVRLVCRFIYIDETGIIVEER